tara:strand:- start:28169 stop:28279 length:111 start_codon:yes stop_codon:yes gene_type:complete
MDDWIINTNGLTTAEDWLDPIFVEATSFIVIIDNLK